MSPSLRLPLAGMMVLLLAFCCSFLLADGALTCPSNRVHAPFGVSPKSVPSSSATGFGACVAISADGLVRVIGAPTGGAGGVYVSRRASRSHTWGAQTLLVGQPAQSSAAQGTSCSLSAKGDTLAFGGPSDPRASSTSQTGSVWVFVAQASGYVQQARIEALTTLAVVDNAWIQAKWGASVALNENGNQLLIGSDQTFPSSLNPVFVYTRSGSTWTQVASLLPSPAVQRAPYGTFISCSGSGRLCAVSGHDITQSCNSAVWVFKTDDGVNWSQVGAKISVDIATSCYFASAISVASNGLSLAIGDRGNANVVRNKGAIHIYSVDVSMNAIVKTQSFYNPAPVVTTAGQPQIGSCVALNEDGSVVFFGAPEDDVAKGATWRYPKVSGAWTAGPKMVGADMSAYSGSWPRQGSDCAISADGNTFIWSGPGDNANVGAVWTGEAEACRLPLLSVVVASASRAYGASPEPTYPFTYSGFLAGDNAANSVITTPTVRSWAEVNSPPGVYPLALVGGSSSTYELVFDGAPTLTITKVRVNATLVASRPYGSATIKDSAITFAPAVLTAADLTSQPVISAGAASLAPGVYPATVSGGGTSMYELVWTAASQLSVTRAPLSVSVAAASRQYGAANPQFTLTTTGLVNGDTVASAFQVLPTFSAPTAAQFSSVGNYAVTAATSGQSANYLVTLSNGLLTVTPSPLTLTAVSTSKAYGAPLPTFTFSSSGLLNGDSLVQPTASSSAVLRSPVGDYPISLSGGSAGANYVLSLLPGTLTVVPAAATLLVSAASAVYGAAPAGLSGSVQPLVDGDSEQAVLAGITFTAPPAGLDVGTYSNTISATGSGSPNYRFTAVVNGTLTVTPAPLTLQAQNQTRQYGTADPLFTFAVVNGLFYGDTPADIFQVQPSFASAATLQSPVGGSFAIVPASAGVSKNYAVSFLPGVLSISQGPVLQVRALAASVVYGGAIPEFFNFTVAGFPAGSEGYVLATPPVVRCPQAEAAPVGSHLAVGNHLLVASGAADANFAFSYLSAELAVYPAPLTLQAQDSAIVYGGALPQPEQLNFTVSGLVQGDQLLDQPTLTINAAASPMSAGATTGAVGVYSIELSAGLASANYELVRLSGLLRITRAPLLVSVQPARMVYGDAVPPPRLVLRGLMNGDAEAGVFSAAPQVRTDATSASRPGNYTQTLSGGDAASYMLQYESGELEVVKRALTLTVSRAEMVQGSALPQLRVVAEGLVNADTLDQALSTPAVASVNASADSPPGEYAISVSGGASAYYELSYVDGTLVIKPAPAVDSTGSAGDSSSSSSGGDSSISSSAAAGSIITSSGPSSSSGATVGSTGDAVNTSTGASSPDVLPDERVQVSAVFALSLDALPGGSPAAFVALLAAEAAAAMQLPAVLVAPGAVSRVAATASAGVSKLSQLASGHGGRRLAAGDESVLAALEFRHFPASAGGGLSELPSARALAAAWVALMNSRDPSLMQAGGASAAAVGGSAQLVGASPQQQAQKDNPRTWRWVVLGVVCGAVLLAVAGLAAWLSGRRRRTGPDAHKRAPTVFEAAPFADVHVGVAEHPPRGTGDTELQRLEY